MKKIIMAASALFVANALCMAPEDRQTEQALKQAAEQAAKEAAAQAEAIAKVLLGTFRSCAGPKCDLRGADLQGQDFSGAIFYRANLNGAKLQNAILYKTDLRGADLRGADLRGADLTRANLEDALLGGMSFNGTTDFTDANLKGATGSGTGGELLNGAHLSSTVMPDGTVSKPTPRLRRE